MTTYTLVAAGNIFAPDVMEWRMEAPTSTRLTARFSGYEQVLQRSGDRLRLHCEWNRLGYENASKLRGILAALVDGTNDVLIPAFWQFPPYGNFGGTPLVAGAGQTGGTINIDGAGLSTPQWIGAGSPFTIENQLYFALEDADSNGSGQVAVKIRPLIRTSPADNAAVDISNPVGRFKLETPQFGFFTFGPNGAYHSFVADFVEAIP